MTMNAAQQVTWFEIVTAYRSWNVGDGGLMPVHELDSGVGATSDQIDAALTQAVADDMAEYGGDDDELTFRPKR